MNEILKKIKYGSKGHPIILKSVESELLYNYTTENIAKIKKVNELLKDWDKLELDDLLAVIRNIKNIIER